jgi:prepilin-type N-terminal cleavage/methylation domain-containing protein
MKKLGTGLAGEGQKGFTIIELLVAIAITAVIALGVAVAVYQMFSVNSSSSNRVLAVNQVQNAGYWMSSDAEMAQYMATGATENGFPLTLRWVDWDGVGHQVIYTLDEDAGEINRQYYLKPVGATEYSLSSESMVAKNISIDTDETYCYIEESGLFQSRRLIINITASVGGFMPVSETRRYEVIPRPSV